MRRSSAGISVPGSGGDAASRTDGGVAQPAHSSRTMLASARRTSVDDFKKSRRAHAAANAHGNDAKFGLAAAAFDQQMARHPGAGHAIGMGCGKGATIHVQSVVPKADAIH